MTENLMSYDNPLYYDIAFSFRDISKEVDVFEACIQKYSNHPVKSILELACGSSPHMIELSKRGYNFTGIDVNDNMLNYSRQKALSAGVKADLINDSMISFALKRQIDFVFIALGSLYITNFTEMNRHFFSVANALHPGGLYFLDWCIQFNFDKVYTDEGDSWELSQDGIRVKTNVKMRPVDYVEQLFEENLIMEVDDHGKHLLLSSKSLKRVIFPQEFLTFIRHRTDFEFIGWWNDWNFTKPLSHELNEITRPITLLRRR